jgi:hypothetical protein
LAYFIIALRFLLDFLAQLNFALHGQWKNALSVSRAHWHFLFQLNKFLHKRTQLMPLVVQKKHPETYNGSIVWDFFAKRKTRFSQLLFNPRHSD